MNISIESCQSPDQIWHYILFLKFSMRLIFQLIISQDVKLTKCAIRKYTHLINDCEDVFSSTFPMRRRFQLQPWSLPHKTGAVFSTFPVWIFLKCSRNYFPNANIIIEKWIGDLKSHKLFCEKQRKGRNALRTMVQCKTCPRNFTHVANPDKLTFLHLIKCCENLTGNRLIQERCFLLT